MARDLNAEMEKIYTKRTLNDEEDREKNWEPEIIFQLHVSVNTTCNLFLCRVLGEGVATNP
jgi:hypothetical protein